MQKRRTIWLTDLVSARHRERAVKLGQRGYEIVFQTSLESLLGEIADKRPSVIFIDDSLGGATTERAILTLSNMPQLQGARFVLILTTRDQKAMRLAAASSFREIIPMDLPDPQWLYRITFATSPKASEFPLPSGCISLSNIATLHLPARLVWVSEDRIRLECRAAPPIGTVLTFAGEFAASLGLPAINITVQETHKSHLKYRFSDAIVGTWEVAEAYKKIRDQAISDLRHHDGGPKCRVFVAAQSPELRRDLLSALDGPRFEVKAALQKQNFVNDPHYSTPHAIIVEDQLCIGENASYFRDMLKQITKGTYVAVIGPTVNVEMLRSNFPGHTIMVYRRFPQNIADIALNKYSNTTSRDVTFADAKSCHIQPNHGLSYGELTVAARVKQVHPMAITIATVHDIGAFGLARIESPLVKQLFGYFPYVKVTETYVDPRKDAEPFSSMASCYFSDVFHEEQVRMAQSLGRMINDYLTRHIGENPYNEAGEHATVVGINSAHPAPTPYEPLNLTQQQLKPLTQEKPKEKGRDSTTNKYVVVPRAVTAPQYLPGQDRASSVSDYIPRRTKRKASDAKMSHWAVFIVVTLFMFGALFGIFMLAGNETSHSGKSYSDSLKQYAPQLDNKDGSSNSSGK